MTESDNSQPQDDSDEDIYKDIPEFNFEDELAKLEGSKETYKQEANDLSEKVKILSEENIELKKSNEVLKKNLSTLLKTAQAEVQRKDSMIEELRTKVESFTFRRIKINTKDKCTSTEDLYFNPEPQFETDKQKSVCNKKKTKIHESRTSSESERKSVHEEDKRKESSSRREGNSDCDNDRKSNCRGNSKTNFRYSSSSQDTYNRDGHKDRKFSKYEDSSGYRRPYRENHRDHLKYDSFDKKRHSRSSDNRFLPRRRNSRERKDSRKDESSERRSRRSGESSERSRRKNSKKDRSRSREISRGSKESSLEKRKSRSSLEKDSTVRIKEQINTKPEVPDNIRSDTDSVENKKSTSLEEEAGTGVRNKHAKEKKSVKQEKRSGFEVFSGKSPLDALYNDMLSSRNSNRFSSSKPATPLPESDLEDGELSTTLTPNEQQNTSESHLEEDWTLSFKNERPNETKPMTLYSRRMMRKFSSEFKNTEKKEEKAEIVEKEPENKKKIEEVEKEPGELTDDENIVESSKEFQELAKVASIESEIIEKAAKENAFKEPLRREFSKSQNLKVEPVLKEIQKEVEKPTKEESSGCKEVESNKDILEVIEFSPFKNNYKLIEISPIKPSRSEHVLDFYNQRPPPKQLLEQNAISSAEGKSSSEKSSPKTFDTSEEKDSWKNSSSEKDFDAELKIIIPPVGESPKEDDKKFEKKEEKEPKKRKKTTEAKPLNVYNEEANCGRGKRRPVSNQETEKLTVDNKSQKRKRKSSESEVEKISVKKRKIKENEPLRKSTRTKRNSKSEPDSKPESAPETENKNEDISSFEFFKPAAKSENSVDVEKTVCTPTDYKMTTTMSVTGVVRLETPNKCVEKLKNLMINEHMIFNVLDSKNNSSFSPLIGSKYIEMTPRRMLKNDLMLTDSEDDSVSKRNEEKGKDEEVIQEEMEVEEEEEDEYSERSESSECDSDSGASDFVDLL